MAFGDKILEEIKRIRELEPERRTLCPKCEYELSEKDGVLYCEFCQYTAYGWRKNTYD